MRGLDMNKKNVQKILVLEKDHISLSKGNKKKTPRQQFLSAFMGETSGDKGEEMAQAFSKGHTEKLRDLLQEAVNSIVKKAARN
jgi:hypothetical protein